MLCARQSSSSPPNGENQFVTVLHGFDHMEHCYAKTGEVLRPNVTTKVVHSIV